jgi:ferritin-like metal-binding protein YciE
LCHHLENKGYPRADKKTVKNLLEDELKDLYSAEHQLIKAIPKMAKGSTNVTLQTAFREHLRRRGRQHDSKSAKLLQMTPGGKKCVGMEGVMLEGAEALEAEGDETILDLGIIGAGSRVEHYEIARYLTAIGLAERMRATEVVKLLKQSLAEEQAAEQKLRKIAAELLNTAATEAPPSRVAAKEVLV